MVVQKTDLNLTARRIKPDDWQAYRDFYKGLSDPAHFRGIMEGRDLDDHETYKKLFAETIDLDGYAMFGVWDGETIVGQTSLFFEDPATVVFVGSERADAYKGRGLGDLFYAVRKKHLAEINFAGRVVTKIKPGNAESLAAARRNGFADTSEVDKYGSKILELKNRDLE